MKVTGTDAGVVKHLSAEELGRLPAAVREAHEARRAAEQENESKNVQQHPEFTTSIPEKTLSDKTVIQAIECANKAVSIASRRFEYSIHEKTKEIMVKVIDAETEEVIREIPPEKILDLVAMIWEMIGLIVDERR
ncbi:MAG: flagellar protein FlaG [Clostridiaceae bacterium]|nr:flagellar protein FlaG [Clostridiaceae bacterium]